MNAFRSTLNAVPLYGSHWRDPREYDIVGEMLGRAWLTSRPARRSRECHGGGSANTPDGRPAFSLS